MVDPVAEWESLRMQALAQGLTSFLYGSTRGQTRSTMIRHALMPITDRPDEDLVEWLTRHMPTGFKNRVKINLIKNTISCDPVSSHRDRLIDYPIGETHPLG